MLDYQVNESYMELLKQYIRWLLFIGGDINGYDNTRIIISEVDWTLKYEWLFYLFLPAIYLVINLGGRWASTLLVFACVLLFIEPVLFIFFTTKYFILFAVGGVAAWTAGKSSSKLLVLKGRSSSCVAVLLIFGALFYPVAYDFVHVVLISSVFFLVVNGCDLFGLLRWKSAKLLGEISYSVYLLHGFVLYMLFSYWNGVSIENMKPDHYSLLMPLVGVLVVIFSSVTYISIERPFVELGKKYFFTKAVGRLARLAGNAFRIGDGRPKF